MERETIRRTTAIDLENRVSGSKDSIRNVINISGIGCLLIRLLASSDFSFLSFDSVFIEKKDGSVF
jgi:hypothetical protein